ncbi:hypothetical protein FKP32DRAFT_1591671 [Trametes sanguinea]|nr:hypothetical protein FKP32DRAFT_1591671 [Trametes sanguinea]
MPVADVQAYFFDEFFAPIHLRILRSLWLNAPSTTLVMDNGDLRSQIRIALAAPANMAFPRKRTISHTTPIDAPFSLLTNTATHRTDSSTPPPSRERHSQSGSRSPAGKPAKNRVTSRRRDPKIPLPALGRACSEPPSHFGERDVPSLKRRRVTSPAPRKRRRVGDSASDTEYSTGEEWLPQEDADGPSTRRGRKPTPFSFLITQESTTYVCPLRRSSKRFPSDSQRTLRLVDQLHQESTTTRTSEDSPWAVPTMTLLPGTGGLSSHRGLESPPGDHRRPASPCNSLWWRSCAGEAQAQLIHAGSPFDRHMNEVFKSSAETGPSLLEGAQLWKYDWFIT